MTDNMDMPREIDAIAKVFGIIINYRARASGLEALVLLEIAREEGCTSRYLQEKLDVDQSTISRATRVLGEGNAKRRSRKAWDGKGLIYSYKDTEAKNHLTPQSRTPMAERLRYALTAKGRELLDGVTDYLSTYFPSRSLSHCQHQT